MTYTTRPTNEFVKFVRGTKEQYRQLVKRNDTLYFVYDDETSSTGELYLGEKLIGDGIGGTTTLEDLIHENVTDGDLLIYDESEGKWIPVSIENAIRTMSGATAATPGQSGLVPTPQAGDQNKFLSGDGTWKEVSVGSLSIDENTLEFTPTEKITLKGYSSAPVGSFLQKTNNGVSWVTASVTGINYKKVSALSDVNETGTIYFVPNNSSSSNSYDEYMLIDNKAELIGNTASINLDGYVTNAVFEQTVGTLQNSIDSKVNQNNFNILSNRVTTIESQLSWQEIIEES